MTSILQFFAFALIMLTGACSPAERPDDLIDDTKVLADELFGVTGAPPGFAIIAVEGSARSSIHTEGVANMATGARVDEHTAFYTASVTKGFTGLLAALLDERGTILLDAPLADYLPRLELPPPLDPSQLTGYELLSHRSRIANNNLVRMTAYYGAPDDDGFYDILRLDTQVLDAPFTYANEGYVVYSQIIREVLQRDWREQLAVDVLAPLGMEETYGWTSRAPASALAHGHALTDHGWAVLPPKDDTIMHAAGGLFISAHDARIWLSAMLDPQQAAERSGIPLAAFEQMLQPHAEQDRSLGNFNRTAYGLGWNIGTYDGNVVYEHGGGYKGHLVYYAFMPEKNLGVAVMTNGDGAAIRFAVALVENALDEMLGREDLAARHADRLIMFAENAPRAFENHVARRSELLTSARWQPTPDLLAKYEGIYRHPRLGDLVVRRAERHLVATLGQEVLTFYPANAPDSFLVSDEPFDRPRPELAFAEDQAAEGPQRLVWRERVFRRVPPQD